MISFWKLVFSLPITATYALYENKGSLSAMWKHVVNGIGYYLISVPVQVAVVRVLCCIGFSPWLPSY